MMESIWQKVKFIFSLGNYVSAGKGVFVCGSMVDWDLEKAIKLTNDPVGSPQYVACMEIPAKRRDFKFLLKDQEEVIYEGGPNRVLPLSQQDRVTLMVGGWQTPMLHQVAPVLNADVQPNGLLVHMNFHPHSVEHKVFFVYRAASRDDTQEVTAGTFDFLWGTARAVVPWTVLKGSDRIICHWEVQTTCEVRKAKPRQVILPPDQRSLQVPWEATESYTGMETISQPERGVFTDKVDKVEAESGAAKKLEDMNTAGQPERGIVQLITEMVKKVDAENGPARKPKADVDPTKPAGDSAKGLAENYDKVIAGNGPAKELEGGVYISERKGKHQFARKTNSEPIEKLAVDGQNSEKVTAQTLRNEIKEKTQASGAVCEWSPAPDMNTISQPEGCILQLIREMVDKVAAESGAAKRPEVGLKFHERRGKHKYARRTYSEPIEKLAVDGQNCSEEVTAQTLPNEVKEKTQAVVAVCEWSPAPDVNTISQPERSIMQLIAEMVDKVDAESGAAKRPEVGLEFDERKGKRQLERGTYSEQIGPPAIDGQKGEEATVQTLANEIKDKTGASAVDCERSPAQDSKFPPTPHKEHGVYCRIRSFFRRLLKKA